MSTRQTPDSPMWAPPREPADPSARFTLTDYAGDMDAPEPTIMGDNAEAGPSRLPGSSTVPEGYSSYGELAPRPLPPLPPIGTSTSTRSLSSTGKERAVRYAEQPRSPSGGLRLHDGDTSHPTSPLSSSQQSHFSNPASPSARSPTTISPLPSLSRSFDAVHLQSDYAPTEVPTEAPTEGDADTASIKEKARFDIDDSALASATPKRKGSEIRPELSFGRFLLSSWPCAALLGLVIAETIIDLCIEGNILWRFNDQVNTTDSDSIETLSANRLPVYLVIFGLAHLWQLILTLVALRTKNTIQVLFVTAFNFAFLAYAVIQIFELRTILGDNLSTSLRDPTSDNPDGSDTGAPQKVSLLTIPLNVLTGLIIAVIATCSLGMVAMAVLIRKEFGWQRYKFLGADLQIRKYYQRFQVFECICYFSAFFCAGFGIQFLFLALDPQADRTEYVITWVMFIISILFLVMGRFAAKYENCYVMAVFGLGLILGIAYFIFKLVRIWQEQYSTYLTVTKSLTIFDILSTLSLIVCFVGGVIVFRDFGKGLKPAVLSRPGAFSSFFGIRHARAPSEKDSEIGMVQSKRLTIS